MHHERQRQAQINRFWNIRASALTEPYLLPFTDRFYHQCWRDAFNKAMSPSVELNEWRRLFEAELPELRKIVKFQNFVEV